MSGWLSLVAIDGKDKPIWAGDTIKYKFQVMDEDRLPFTGIITDARCDLMKIDDGVAGSLLPPLFKAIGTGIKVLDGNILEIIFVPDDTSELPGATYVAAVKVRSPDFGEVTTARRLELQKKLTDVDIGPLTI